MPERSLIDILRNMELKFDDYSPAYSAMEKYLTSTAKNFSYLRTVGQKQPASMNFKGREVLFKRFLHLIRSKDQDLKALLHLTVYSFKDSEDIVNNLREEFTYYINTGFALDKWSLSLENIDPSKCKQVEFDIRYDELPIIGRLLAPSLIMGYSVRLRLSDENHVPFFVFLRDLLKEAGAPDGMLNISDRNYPLSESSLYLRGIVEQRYSPMIVFQDADLESAKENALSAAWGFRGKAFFSLSHVYVQESVYDKFVTLLETSVKDAINMNVFLEDPKYSSEERIMITDEPSYNLKVLRLHKEYPHRIFVGWDPRDIHENKKYELSLAVLPFRTREEAISLVNKSKFGCTASLWTESISTANYVSSRIDANVIWINSYCLFHPSVPVESQKESRIILNGISLANYLEKMKLMTDAIGDSSSKIISLQLEEPLKDWHIPPLFVRENIHTAIEMAQRGVKLYKKYDKGLLLSFINNLKTKVPQDTLVNNIFKEPILNSLELIYKSSQLENNTAYLTLDDVNVCINCEPLGIIWVVLKDVYDALYEDFITLLYLLIINGNSIIVTSFSEELRQFVNGIFKIFNDGLKLPDGVLNYIQAPLIEFYPPYYNENCNENARLTNRYYFLTKDVRSNDCFRGPFCEILQHKWFRNNFSNFFYSLMSKVVWMPNV